MEKGKKMDFAGVEMAKSSYKRSRKMKHRIIRHKIYIIHICVVSYTRLIAKKKSSESMNERLNKWKSLLRYKEVKRQTPINICGAFGYGMNMQRRENE